MSDDKRGTVDAHAGTVGVGEAIATDGTLPASNTGDKALSVDTTIAQSEAAITNVPPGAIPRRYQLTGRLGAGGMGDVLLANDQQLGRDVAIKRMRVSSPALEARFLREARIQGRLEHPAIVPVHELATDSDGRPFFVMKRVTGTTLADMLEGKATMYSREKLLRAFAEVCLAVEFAHSRGIVHRDLKPSNIMLGDFGEVYVLDWGIARILDEAEDDVASTPHSDRPDATEVGAVIGTLGYMSPEQMRGQGVDGRTDVFALGCILFEIIGGKPLLPRTLDGLDGAFSTIVRRASSRAIARDMAPELVTLCIEATKLEPSDRMQTARELGQRVEQFLDGDRDLSLRKSLAATHVEAARAALSAGDGEEQRATAMREAGRAIALDPSGSDAAQLIGRMMLEPPRAIPPEVKQRLEATADATARRRAWLVGTFALGLFAGLPLFVWMGIRGTTPMIVLAFMIVANSAFALRIAKRKQAATILELHIAAAVDAILVGTIAHIFTPFLIAPGVAALSATMYLSDPRMKLGVIVCFALAAVLGPYALEMTHLLPQTVSAKAGDLVLHSSAVVVSLPATTIALSLYVVSIIALSALVARQLGESMRTSLLTVELQAWHLRKLVGS